jgi:putative membrane protein
MKSQNPNRARDHLANERTFLSWIRTAISLMGFGVVIVKLRFTPVSTPYGHGWELGLVFALIGVLMTLGASRQYFVGLKSIEEECFEPSRLWIVVCSALVGLLGLGVLAYLFTLPAAPTVP